MQVKALARIEAVAAAKPTPKAAAKMIVDLLDKPRKNFLKFVTHLNPTVQPPITSGGNSTMELSGGTR